MILLKQLSSAQEDPEGFVNATHGPVIKKFFHYRTQTGNEVGIILENRKGEVVGIEVKSSQTISSEDRRGLDILSQELGNKMVLGIFFILEMKLFDCERSHSSTFFYYLGVLKKKTLFSKTLMLFLLLFLC